MTGGSAEIVVGGRQISPKLTAANLHPIQLSRCVGIDVIIGSLSRSEACGVGIIQTFQDKLHPIFRGRHRHVDLVQILVGFAVVGVGSVGVAVGVISVDRDLIGNVIGQRMQEVVGVVGIAVIELHRPVYTIIVPYFFYSVKGVITIRRRGGEEGKRGGSNEPPQGYKFWGLTQGTDPCVLVPYLKETFDSTFCIICFLFGDIF